MRYLHITRLFFLTLFITLFISVSMSMANRPSLEDIKKEMVAYLINFPPYRLAYDHSLLGEKCRIPSYTYTAVAKYIPKEYEPFYRDLANIEKTYGFICHKDDTECISAVESGEPERILKAFKNGLKNCNILLTDLEKNVNMILDSLFFSMNFQGKTVSITRVQPPQESEYDYYVLAITDPDMQKYMLAFYIWFFPNGTITGAYSFAHKKKQVQQIQEIMLKAVGSQSSPYIKKLDERIATEAYQRFFKEYVSCTWCIADVSLDQNLQYYANGTISLLQALADTVDQIQTKIHLQLTELLIASVQRFSVPSDPPPYIGSWVCTCHIPACECKLGEARVTISLRRYRPLWLFFSDRSFTDRLVCDSQCLGWIGEVKSIVLPFFSQSVIMRIEQTYRVAGQTKAMTIEAMQAKARQQNLDLTTWYVLNIALRTGRVTAKEIIDMIEAMIDANREGKLMQYISSILKSQKAK